MDGSDDDDDDNDEEFDEDDQEAAFTVSFAWGPRLACNYI